MDYEELKEKLIKKEISVLELSNEEVKELTKLLKESIKNENKRLEKINKEIRKMKVKIDNWGN